MRATEITLVAYSTSCNTIGNLLKEYCHITKVAVTNIHKCVHLKVIAVTIANLYDSNKKTVKSKSANVSRKFTDQM